MHGTIRGPSVGHLRAFRGVSPTLICPPSTAGSAPYRNAAIGGPRSGLVANAGLDKAEPFGHYKRVVADRRRGAEELGHALAAEEVFV